MTPKRREVINLSWFFKSWSENFSHTDNLSETLQTAGMPAASGHHNGKRTKDVPTED